MSWENKEYLIWLTQLKGVGPVTQRLLIEKLGSPAAVYGAASEELESTCGLSSKAAAAITADRRKGDTLERSRRILDECFKRGIKLLAAGDPRYPAEVAAVHGMPVLLYYKGILPEDSPGIAIVGARRCGEYAKAVACEAADFLARQKVTVISGMAKGIDGYAHTACINAGGHTLAFLGGGVDVCYPKEHDMLHRAIIENGVAISEYPPGTKPYYRNFARRNHLISSWAQKVLVVQAGEKSGALITARHALSANKKVLALPDRTSEKTSIGSNRLLLEGATAYLEKEQLLEGLEGIKKSVPHKKSKAPADQDKQAEPKAIGKIKAEILRLVSDSPKTADEICILLAGRYEIFEIEEAIFELEMARHIDRRGGRIIGGDSSL